jgi:hypothetical protein
VAAFTTSFTEMAFAETPAETEAIPPMDDFAASVESLRLSAVVAGNVTLAILTGGGGGTTNHS